MSLRPDLVECWVFRVPEPAGRVPEPASRVPGPANRAGGPAGRAADEPLEPRPGLEILLIRRAPGRIFPGLWQCVTGGVEPGERVPLAALRELREETGFGPGELEAFFDLDQVAPFYDEGSDGVVVSAIFAARIRPEAEPILSHEHDAFRWVGVEGAARLAIWPSYAESMRRIEERLLDAETAEWFRVTLDGRRARR